MEGFQVLTPGFNAPGRFHLPFSPSVSLEIFNAIIHWEISHFLDTMMFQGRELETCDHDRICDKVSAHEIW